MDYEKTQQIKRIQDDITRSTYDYFKYNDRVFRDFIYGDPYYQTLADLSYLFLNTRQLDYSFDCQSLGVIDIDEIVSDLYGVFMKADKKTKNKKPALSDRHRKNYIFKSLRKATWRQLKKQYKRFIGLRKRLAKIDEILQDNLKKFRYVSFDVYEEGNLVDQLSYDRWVSDAEADRVNEAKKGAVREMMSVLNSAEADVIDLVLEGLHYADIAKSLDLTTEQIRKIFHRAKIKLKNHYIQN